MSLVREQTASRVMLEETDVDLNCRYLHLHPVIGIR